MIAFYSLIGNDVCNEFWDTEQFMTTTDQFYDNTMIWLTRLAQTLPPESHVVLVGLIDGGVLYNALASRLHPLGSLNGDLRYSH